MDLDLTALQKLRDSIATLRGELMTKKAFLPMPGDMPQQMQPGQGDPAQQGAPPQGAPPQGAPPQGAPPQGAPPQGAPPQGAPPQGAPPPQDPSQGGQPPMDPSQMPQGGPPPAQGGQPDLAQVVDQLTQGLEEIFGIVQELGQAQQQLQAQHTQTEQKIDVIVRALDQPAPAPAGMQQGIPMDPSQGGQPPMDPNAMMQQGPPPGAEQMAQGMIPQQ
jgi:hypothetical protein